MWITESTQHDSYREKREAVLAVLVFFYIPIFSVVLFLSLAIGSWVNAQTTDTLIEYDYTKEVDTLSDNYDQILDYQDSKRCIAYSDKEKLNCTTFEDTIIYLYKTDLTPAEEVVNKNTIKLSDNTFKIYGSDAFYQDEQTNTWKQTEYGVVEKNDFQAVQDYELKSADEVSYLNNPFKIYKVNAQTYASGGDGLIGDGDATYLTAQQNTTGEYAQTGTNYRACGNWKSGATYYVDRLSFPFDTSALDLDAYTVASSSIFFYSAGNNGGTPGTKLNLVGMSAMADTSVPSVSDFNKFGTTKLSDYEPTATTWATQKYYRFELNATGLAQINDVFSLFGVRMSDDISASAPTDAYSYAKIYVSENTGTANDPYLLIDLEENEQEPDPEPEATTTLSELPSLPFVDDLTVITGRTDHYELSTTAADWSELHYYRIPFLVWVILAIPLLWIANRLLLEFLIRWRK